MIYQFKCQAITSVRRLILVSVKIEYEISLCKTKHEIPQNENTGFNNKAQSAIVSCMASSIMKYSA